MVNQGGAKDIPVVLTKGLTKVFKDFWMRSRVRAVEGLDLEIHDGEIFGLLGPNGSGKSTTIKMLLGLLHKSSGFIAVFGKPPTDVSVKERIGVLPEESYLYPFLNARETLDYYGKLFQLDHRARKRRIDELLDMVGLNSVAHRQIKEYSKGMQRRIGLAQALINDPEFLILDEPTTGLDPIGARQVKDLIIELGRRGKTVLLSSHQLSDVEDCVDRMVILYGGRKRAQGTCDELLTAQSRMSIETDVLDDSTVTEIEQVLGRHGASIRRVAKPRQRLEDLFMDIVDRARDEKLVTHGAQQGGATAAFLLGQEGEGATGETLIDDLVSASEAAPVEDETVDDATHEAAEPDVIESLVSEAPDAVEIIEEEKSRATDDSETTNDQPDLGVIESLLGGDDQERKPRSEGSDSA